MNLKELKDPFSEADIEWRIGRCGTKGQDGVWALALAYITARAIHDRLDDVCGEDSWQLRYKEHLGETVCEIGVKVGDEWIWKAGGSGKTDFEAFKGGLSGSEKRAGVPWGIGRYLYKLKEAFVDVSLQKKQGWNYQAENKKKNIPAFYWKIPSLPSWAIPANSSKKEKTRVQPAADKDKKPFEEYKLELEAAFKEGVGENWWKENNKQAKKDWPKDFSSLVQFKDVLKIKAGKDVGTHVASGENLPNFEKDV